MKCPGQDTRYWKPGDIFEEPCPHCGHAIEFFKDESTRKCRQCHRLVTNPRMDFGCAAYCKYAEQCLGELSPDLLSKRTDLLKDRVAVEMKKYFRHDFKSINHAIRVARYAEQIAIDSHDQRSGNLSSEHGEPGTHGHEVAGGWREAPAALPQEGATRAPLTQRADLAILISASYLHGIACPEAGSEGPSSGAVCGGVGSVSTLLEGLGATEELIAEVIETIRALRESEEKGVARNAKILRDAHASAELQEQQEQGIMTDEAARAAIERRFETEGGRTIARKILLKELISSKNVHRAHRILLFPLVNFSLHLFLRLP